MKNASPGEGVRRGDKCPIPNTSPRPFSLRLTKFERVGPFNSKIAIGTFELECVGTFNFAVFAQEGKPISVGAAGVRSKYTGRYERTFMLFDDFRSELLAAVLARLKADD